MTYRTGCAGHRRTPALPLFGDPNKAVGHGVASDGMLVHSAGRSG
jgi:hypothetical protein